MKKLLLFTVLFCFVLGNDSFSQLVFQNGSMEVPDDSLKYNLWTDAYLNGNLVGWWAEPGVLDSGRERFYGEEEVQHGKYCAYAYNLDETVWNLCGTVEAQMLDLNLTFYIQYSWCQDPTDDFTWHIKFATYEGVDTANYELLETVSDDFDPANIDLENEPPWIPEEIDVTLPESAVGKNLLIGYDITSAGTAIGWFNFDNFVLTVTGTAGISKTSGELISIFPNPSTGIFTLEGIHNDTEYQLFDLSGKQIAAGLLGNNRSTLDLSGLSKGMYLLRTSSAKSSGFHKLILK
jgi:hypothetical protein